MIEGLTQRIAEKSASLAVIGLGYVGLPVAAMLAQTGYRVVGVDVNKGRVERINAGESPIGGNEPGINELITAVVADGRLRATDSYGDLSTADVLLICVDTPVDPTDHRPSYAALRSALGSLGRVLKRGSLVIIESTIAPGTMTGVVIPELERASGMMAGQDFFVGHCPERVMPGVLINNLVHMSRAVGGQTPDVARAMARLYGSYVQAELDVTEMLTAELVKTGENAYRDVQIAFANELALICEELGADVFAVRELLNKSPGRAMLLPGAGVGGHCIPKDPWLLIANAGTTSSVRLIPAAREVNDSMPGHIVSMIESALRAHGISLHGAHIAVLGYAFREDTDDDRESPSRDLVERLTCKGATVRTHDPYVPGHDRSLTTVLHDADAAVIMVAHRTYLNLDLELVKCKLRCPVVVDGRRVLDGDEVRSHGLDYYCVGIGSGH